MTISYLITLYNKEEFAGEAIDAVMAEQARTGGEIIIYDDVSTDGSRDIARQRIEAYAGRPIRLIEGERNIGVSLATNRLIALAAQPYIHLVDADDLLIPGSTAQLLRLVRECGLGFVHGHVRPRGADPGRQQYATCHSIEDPIGVVLRHLPATPSTCLFAAEALKKTCPLPDWARHTQDFAIFLRVACQGAAMGFADEVVALCPAMFDACNNSSASAASYAEQARTVAFDAGNMPLRHLRSATRRYAGRAMKYFGTEGESRLTAKQKFDLWRWRQLARMAPAHVCVGWLVKTASILDLDRHVVKGLRKA